jgi:spore coat polysaccharide biosynthesis protein SpsF
MLQTLGMVQIAWEKSRLRAGFRRRLAGKTFVEWAVRRVTDCQRLDGVVLVVGDSDTDREIAELAPSDVPVFSSRQSDPLARFVAAVDEYNPAAIVRVAATTPFIDASLIDQLVSTAASQQECDYVGYTCRDGQPANLSPIAVAGEWVRSKALRRAARRATDPIDRQLVTRYIYSRPEDFCVRLLPAPAQLDRDDVRLSMDLEEDWEHTQDIFDALGPEIDWQRLAGLLDHQPALRKRMQLLNRTAGAV